jgi:hypothetical protein
MDKNQGARRTVHRARAGLGVHARLVRHRANAVGREQHDDVARTAL